MALCGSEQQDQNTEQTQEEQKDHAEQARLSSESIASLPEEKLTFTMQSSEAKEEGESVAVTLFRAANFFVRAFTPGSNNETRQKTPEEAAREKRSWASAQKQRLIDAETRLLPRVEINNPARWRVIPLPAWFEGLIVALFLGISLVVQALSLFNYPAYTSDEGTYMADAWAVLHGNITPYTFTYSHPPLGWVQIAAWTTLTGGITSFGNAINSGRVLMLILATASSLLLYLITGRLSGSRSAALLAMIIYTLSPLSLLYRHEVLLDNIGTFWLLLSLFLITNGKSRLAPTALAAVALGAAILSKGVFVIFIPVMLYAVRLHATTFQRKFSLVAFIYITLAIGSAYVLFALLKGELFPSGGQLHSSLIGTLLQTFQGPGAQSLFRQSWHSWTQADPLLLIASFVALLINIVGGMVNRFQLLAALLAATFCLFLLNSRTVYSFALVPLLPFLVLNFVLALNNPLRYLTRKTRFHLLPALLLFILIGTLIPPGMQNAWTLLAKNQAEPQMEAMLWIRDNVPREAVVITNSYLYTDLHDPQGMGVGGGQPFAHAQIYSDAALDPAIATGELGEDWRKIDFLVVDSSMLQDIQVDTRYFLLNQALHHSDLRAEFGSSEDGTQIEIFQIIHT